VIPYRQIDGIVLTIALIAGPLFEKHSQPNANGAVLRPYPGATSTSWIGTEFNLNDENGFLVDADGTTITPVFTSV
jgi:hypothetical protein